jgi:Dolichyl-phosphate-mannose-protein mannosyltransferase
MWTGELGAIFATVLLAAASCGAGVWLFRIYPASFSTLDRLALDFVGGFGILGTVLFIVGQFAYTFWSIMTILALSILAGALALVLRGSDGRRIAWAPRISKPPLVPTAAIAFVLSVTALGGLAEITGDFGNDAIAYHLLGPKVWLREGVVRPVLDNCHTAFPVIAETLYGALIACGGLRGPGFSAVFTFGSFLLVVGALARRGGLDRKASWWAAALVATMPALYEGSHTTFVDAIYASFVLAAARIAFDASRGREYLAAGFFCGFALGTKYTGLVGVPLLLVSMAAGWELSSEGGWRSTAKKLAIICAGAAAIAVPFYVRNWILLGSPIYPPPPVLSRFVHVKYLSAGAIRDFHAYMYNRGKGLGRGLTAYLLLPFKLTYETSYFHGAGGIGLAPLALGPFGLIASRQDKFLRGLALLALLLTTAWFLTDQESRFLIDVYAIATVFAVGGWRYAVETAPKWGPALSAAVIACSILYGSYMIGRARVGDVHAALSNRYARLRDNETIPFVAGFDYLNTAPAVRSVLILDPRLPPYYLDVPYVKPFGQWGELTLPGAPDLAQVLAQVHSLGVSHILDVHSAISDFRVPETLPGLKLVFAEPDERIYEIE